jgi:hypothetical protein
MPNHLLHSDGGQAIALLVLIVGGICVRYWRITLSVLAALLIGTALIALSVVTDLHIAHHVTVYLRDLGRLPGEGAPTAGHAVTTARMGRHRGCRGAARPGGRLS